MYDTSLHIAGSMVGNRENIGICDLSRMFQALHRADFRKEEIVWVDDYQFVCYRTPDNWAADLLIKEVK